MLLGLLNPLPALGGGAASGIVPFFRVPIPPVPLLPAPLAPAVPVLGKPGPGLALLISFGAGYAVGTWIWDLLNKDGPASLPKPPAPDNPFEQYPEGEASTTGMNRWLFGPGSFETIRQAQPGEWDWATYNYPETYSDGGAYPGEKMWIIADGWITREGLSGYSRVAIKSSKRGIVSTLLTGGPFRSVNMPGRVQPLSPNPTPVPIGPWPDPPGTPDPAWKPEPLPEIKPVPAPAPVPVPAPLPLPQPEPQPQPKPEPLPPQPAAPPKPGDPPKVAPPMAPPITPARPKPPRPQPPDLFPPLLPDGTPKPEKPKDPETRPPGEETTPEGIVGLPGQAPRPDLVGIAQELGKVEQKLLQLQRKPDPTVDLGPVIDLLMRLLGLIDEPYGEGQFELYPVCETGGDGQPKPPLIVQWPGGIGQINQIQSMVEALAVLHQYGKELRQPVCKTKPIGEEVTVRFLEVP